MTNPDLSKTHKLKLFLCGDVMTGRGIDQALPHSVDPVLYESHIKDARDYLWLAEQTNGDIDIPVPYHHIWGDALKVWEENAPDLRIINLETSITTHDEPWPDKGINYRMHTGNVEVLSAAGIDHCSLANNHTMDWGYQGLRETMQTLDQATIKYSGAGNNGHEAGKPSLLETDNRRVHVFSYGSPSSGIPLLWAANKDVPGINLLTGLNKKAIGNIKHQVDLVKDTGDTVVFSIHWGGNWGYTISVKQKEFARRLIDEAGVDVIFGHSSHHPMGIEVYNGKLIIYGAGDFINDYEGIIGHQHYRGELSLMYFPQIDAGNGKLESMKLVPMEMKKFRLNLAEVNDAVWLQKMLNREGEQLGTGMRMDSENSLWMEW